METFSFIYHLVGKSLKGERVVCGVDGSNNLEVIVEENSNTLFDITTTIINYKSIWKLVIDDFVQAFKPVNLKFIIHDNGATPAVVALRLRQAFEMFQGYAHQGLNYIELDARERIHALVDKHTFKEWLVDDNAYMSPHLPNLGLPCQADDGIVIGSASLFDKTILIGAQQKDFMGGAVGEVHGAKLTGLFRRALQLNVDAVILLIDSGGVRLQEANAGEIAISEIIRAIWEVRQRGVITIGVICGKNGAYGGMGIISTCLDYIIMDEIGRTGVSGAEVIQTVKGIEAFNAQDRSLVWRVYGGKTRYLQGIAMDFVKTEVPDIKTSLKYWLDRKPKSLLAQAKHNHAMLSQRFHDGAQCREEADYLHAYFPKYADHLFDMDFETFIAAAKEIK